MANYPKSNLVTKDEVVTPYKQAFSYAFTERFERVGEVYIAADEAVADAPVVAARGFKKNPAIIVISMIFALLAVAFAALSYFEMAFLADFDIFGGTLKNAVDAAIAFDVTDLVCIANIALLASVVGALALVLTAIIGLAANGRTLYWIAGLVSVVFGLAAGALVLVDAGFDTILETLGYGYIALAGAELLAFIFACFGNCKK